MKATTQIFLSYAREDEEKVKNLHQQLSDAAFKPWMDKKDILPGEIWQSCIQKAIQRSDFFLACLSAKSVKKRGFLQKEIEDALNIWLEKLEDDIYLIPVRLEDCEVAERLRKFQWVNLFEEDGWTRLVKAIQVGMERREELPPDREELPPGTEIATPDKGPKRILAEFTGLEEGMFNFFVTHDDEDTRRWVRDTVQSFAEKIQARLWDFDSFYQDYDVGTLRSKGEECWVAFGPRKLEYRKWAHQTVLLRTYALDVFANVELKPAIARLRKKIRQDKQAFREVIAKLPAPFSVQVVERKKKQVRLYDYHSIASLEAYGLKDPELGPHGFNYIETLLEQIHLPNLVVRRPIDRDLALELSRKDQARSLVNEVVRIMQAFHPLVKFINEPEYTRLMKSTR